MKFRSMIGFEPNAKEMLVMDATGVAKDLLTVVRHEARDPSFVEYCKHGLGKTIRTYT